MKLAEVKLKNWRGYRSEFSLGFNNFTAIIGRNDIGKSAILDALSVYFGKSKGDPDDLSKGSEGEDIEITCVFTDFPTSLTIDATVETSLEAEHLLNSDGSFELKRVYRPSGSGLKLVSAFAVANHPSAEGRNDLHTLKISDLKTRAEKLGINLDDVNKTKKAEVRRAIWKDHADEKVSMNVDLQKEGGKDVNDAISPYLPEYWLFKSDRASSDKDAEAQDPLNAAISEALASTDIQTKLAEIEKQVKESVERVAKATLEKLKELEPDLASTLDPDISTKKAETLFTTSITGENGVPLNKRGSGVRRLVLLSFFRAKVEKEISSIDSKYVIYAIEEPETSQHPDYQRMIISTLQEITADPSRQVVITTHSPMLARTVPVEMLRFIQRVAGEMQCEDVTEDTNRRISDALGILPDHNVKLFIGVEGPNDISFLKGISRLLHQVNGAIPSLETREAEGRIIFMPLGGSNLSIWNNRLSGLNIPEFHIYDRDTDEGNPPKYSQQMAAVNSLDDCKAVCTHRRELENYVPARAVVEAYSMYGIELEIEEFSNFEDVPVLVAKKVHQATADSEWDDLSPDTQRSKESRCKKILNGQAISLMTPDEANDLEEIRDWLEEIAAYIE